MAYNVRMARPTVAAETVPFAVTGIDHIVLRAHDPRRLVAFYRDVLGCPIEREQADIGLTQLRAGECLIDIVPQVALAGTAVGDPGGSANLDHVCLRIAPFDAAQVRAYLGARGVSCGEPALRFGAQGEGLSLYLQDPEGNGIELKAAARLPESDRA